MVHNCRTQHSTEQFWLFPILTYRQSPKLRCCLLEQPLQMIGSLLLPIYIYQYGPKAWNQLPTSVRHINCVTTFKRHLKTILFTEAYSVSPWHYLPLIRNFCFFNRIYIVQRHCPLCGATQISIVIVWLIVITSNHSSIGLGFRDTDWLWLPKPTNVT